MRSPTKLRPGAKFSRGEKVIQFIERFCIVPEGDLVGKRVKLAPFQRAFILDVYDNPATTRRAYLSIARKNAKTATIACIMLAHVAGPEARLNSRIISGAMSKEQAAEVYNYAAKMVELSPQLSAVCRIVPSNKRIIGLSKNVEYQAVSAEGKTAHGKSPVLAILDEVGQIRGPQSDFVDAIVTAQGAYEDAMLFAISTQAPNDNDLFSIWLDDAQKSEDKRIVCHLYSAPRDCELTDPEGWAAANPALGLFRSLKDVQEQADRATRMPSFEPTFRNLVLNQRVEMVAPLVSRNVWRANGSAPDEEIIRTGKIFAGLDLSARTDLTALVYGAFGGPKGKERWHVKARFWTPEATLAERAKRDRAQYDVWAKDGWITPVPGVSLDYEALARDIAEELDGLDLTAIHFDRWRIDVLKKELERLGVALPLVPFGQGFREMAPAIDTLETLLLNNQICHGNNPVLTMCVANARVEKDSSGNRKFNKAKATGRIDGAVALAMMLGGKEEEKVPEPTYQMFFV